MSALKTEQQSLESNLDRALTEAITKTSKSAESTTNKSESYEKDVWAAAEACEYASLVYSLMYKLEGSSPMTLARKKDVIEDPVRVVQETVESLGKVRALRQKQEKGPILQAYTTLREAADNLRNAYLSITRARPRT